MESAWASDAKPSRGAEAFGSAALEGPSDTMRLQNVRKARAFLKLERGNPVVLDLAEQGRRPLMTDTFV
jgi:hypothetical protein